MPPTSPEHVSPWLDRARQRFPSLISDETADVVVVGGGITGLTTALRLAEAGARVIVLEAGRIAGGTTGNTTAKVTSQHGPTYRQLVRHHGLDTARRYATANQDAIETVAGLAATAKDGCGLVRSPALIYASSPEETADLEDECETAQELGLPASMTQDTGLPFDTDSALVYTDQAHLNPVSYCHALVSALAASGALIFENSRVTDVEEQGEFVDVRTGGSVRAGAAVFATLLPIIDRAGLFAKTRPSRSYGIAGTLVEAPPQGMYISAGQPIRSLRPWPEGGDTGFIVVGEAHEPGSERATADRWEALEHWAGDIFDVASLDYRWSAQDYSTPDLLPYVGRSPLSRHLFCATGFRKWGMTNATVAADVLAGLIGGHGHPDADIFDPGRIGGLAEIGTVVKDSLHFAGHLIGDRLGRMLAPSISKLAPGEGRIVEVEGRRAAAYRTPDGDFKVVSATCTHLGCTVKWNDAELSWDCPCHGSRFDVEGSVLNAPATEPLASFDPGTIESGSGEVA